MFDTPSYSIGERKEKPLHVNCSFISFLQNPSLLILHMLQGKTIHKDFCIEDKIRSPFWGENRLLGTLSARQLLIQQKCNHIYVHLELHSYAPSCNHRSYNTTFPAQLQTTGLNTLQFSRSLSKY